MLFEKKTSFREHIFPAAQANETSDNLKWTRGIFLISVTRQFETRRHKNNIPLDTEWPRNFNGQTPDFKQFEATRDRLNCSRFRVTQQPYPTKHFTFLKPGNPTISVFLELKIVEFRAQKLQSVRSGIACCLMCEYVVAFSFACLHFSACWLIHKYHNKNTRC